MEPGDELIAVCNDFGDDGNQARQIGVEKATGSHILFCDDDDVFVAGALAAIRRFATENPGRIGLFRRRLTSGELQWRHPALYPGSVQCMSMIIPNLAGQVGRWGQDPGWSDSHFVEETSRLQGQPPIFVDVVIGQARPERNPVRRLRYALAMRTRLRAALARWLPLSRA